MIIVMKENAVEAQVNSLTGLMRDKGMSVCSIPGQNSPMLGVSGNLGDKEKRTICNKPGVYDIINNKEPYQLAAKAFHPADTSITIKNVTIGGDEIAVMSGPCSVETEKQVHEIAALVKKAGAKILRGGAYKPRTSPYSFHGLGETGLKYLHDAAQAQDMITISEVMDTSTLEIMCRYTDILQIGARNMQNFSLLKAVGQTNLPVLLKRGMSATIEDLLMSAEHIMAQGNSRVILCERGIRTFEKYTRNTMDISAVPVVKMKSHLPIIVDPSHGTGIRDMVAPMARAAIAAGADGLMIEVHNHPEEALCDGAQSLLPNQFESLMQELKIISWAIGRKI